MNGLRIALLSSSIALAAPQEQVPVAPSELAWARVLEQDPDETVIADPAVRARIAATGLPWLVEDTLSGIELVLIPPGTYLRGAADDDDEAAADERPRHAVVVHDPLYFGRFEVTQAEWQRVMETAPSFFEGERLPVESIDRFDVGEFLARTALELPTEAEWEYACRAGDADGELDEHAWYRGNAKGRSHPVGQKPANAFGLHDMLGNVWEWTASPYLADEYARYRRPHDAAVVRARGAQVSLRGGSWYESARRVRSTARYFGAWSFTAGHVGFRVLRRIDPPDPSGQPSEPEGSGKQQEPPGSPQRGPQRAPKEPRTPIEAPRGVDAARLCAPFRPPLISTCSTLFDS